MTSLSKGDFTTTLIDHVNPVILTHSEFISDDYTKEDMSAGSNANSIPMIPENPSDRENYANSIPENPTERTNGDCISMVQPNDKSDVDFILNYQLDRNNHIKLNCILRDNPDRTDDECIVEEQKVKNHHGPCSPQYKLANLDDCKINQEGSLTSAMEVINYDDVCTSDTNVTKTEPEKIPKQMRVKLTDEQKKEICLHKITHPQMKAETITECDYAQILDDDSLVSNKPVNLAEAQKGIMSVIIYLEANPAGTEDYIHVLWKIYDHLTGVEAESKDVAISENGSADEVEDIKEDISHCEAEIPSQLSNDEQFDESCLMEDDDRNNQEQVPPSYDTSGEHSCGDCGVSFPQLQNLKSHMQSHCRKSGEPKTEEKPRRTVRKQTDSVSKRGNILKKVPKNEPEIATSDKKSQRVKKVKSKTADVLQTDNKQRKSKKTLAEHKYEDNVGFVCNICGKTYKKLTHVRRHEMSHSDHRPYKCQQCGKGFTEQSNLKTHMRIHTGERPFLCPICGKCFTQSSSLHAHMTTHTGEKKFKCSECDSSFSQQCHLQEHMSYVHIKDRPFNCTTCDKGFIRRRYLELHMRVHTGEKPHKCSICGKTFMQKGYLCRHMEVHSGEKPHQCSTCGQRFVTRTVLNGHTRTHTGERPFCCKICGKSFSQNGTLHNHYKMHKK